MLYRSRCYNAKSSPENTRGNPSKLSWFGWEVIYNSFKARQCSNFSSTFGSDNHSSKDSCIFKSLRNIPNSFHFSRELKIRIIAQQALPPASQPSQNNHRYFDNQLQHGHKNGQPILRLSSLCLQVPLSGPLVSQV